MTDDAVTCCYMLLHAVTILFLCRLALVVDRTIIKSWQEAAGSSRKQNETRDMKGDTEMSVAEKIRSNVEMHGIQYAASVAKKQRIPFDTFYFVIFGKYPTK